MSYLSRIRLNPLRAKGQEFLRNPRAVHAAVLGGIAEQPITERVLWRLDAHHRQVGLLVLTASRPDWSHIVEQAGWPDAEGDHALVRDYSPVLGHLGQGREFAFRLTANPVQSTPNPQRRTAEQIERYGADVKPARGFRLGHRTAAHQLDWLLRRTDTWGFAVPQARTDPAGPGLTSPSNGSAPHEVRIVNSTRYQFAKKGLARPVTMQAITYEGRLIISDPDKLRSALLNGIGPSKAYGCGLLTLAPLPDSQGD